MSLGKCLSQLIINGLVMPGHLFFSTSVMSFILLMSPTPELSDLWGIPVKLFFNIYLSINDTELPCMELNFIIITFARIYYRICYRSLNFYCLKIKEEVK